MTKHVCYICGSHFYSDFALQTHQSSYCKIFYVPSKKSKITDNIKERSVNASKINDENAYVATEMNEDDKKAAEEIKTKKQDEKTLEVPKTLDTPKTNEVATTKLTEKEITKEAEVKALTETSQTIEAFVKSRSAEKAFKRQKSLITAPEVDPHESENICNICGYRFEYSFALRKHKALYCKVFNTSDPQKATEANINEFDKLEEEKDYELGGQEDEQYEVFDLRDTLKKKAEFKKSVLYRRSGSQKDVEEQLKSGKGSSHPTALAVKAHQNPKNSVQYDSRVQGLKAASVTTLSKFEKTSFSELLHPKPESDEKYYSKRNSSPEDFLSRNDRSKSPLKKKFHYLKYKSHSNSRRYSTPSPTREHLESYRRTRECSIASRHHSASPSRKSRPGRYSPDHIPRRSHSSPRTIYTRKSNSPPGRSQQTLYSPDIPALTRSTLISPQRRIESFSRHYSATSNENPTVQSPSVRRYNKVIPKAKAIFCEKCGDSIRSYQELLKPNCKHHKNMFPCPVCSLKFPDLNTLILHQDHAHEPDEVTLKELENSTEKVRYYCYACGMRFNFIKNLISHKMLHNNFFHANSSSTPVIQSTNPTNQSPSITGVVCDEKRLENFDHMSTNYAPREHHKFEHICYICQLKFLTFRDLQIHMLESSDHFLNEPKSVKESFKTTNHRQEQYSKPRAASVCNPKQPQYQHRVISQQTPITPEPKSSFIKRPSSDKMSSASNDSSMLPTKATSTPEYQVAYTMPFENVEIQVKQEDGEEPFKRYFQ
ncbi:zinc finger protein 43-like [Euwallacea similis]|uniref:zinc finger protein 43-like n=1 Tax=Euwallacea similis TaxID=1736056 RepID=UPI00344CB6AA